MDPYQKKCLQVRILERQFRSFRTKHSLRNCCSSDNCIRMCDFPLLITAAQTNSVICDDLKTLCFGFLDILDVEYHSDDAQVIHGTELLYGCVCLYASVGGEDKVFWARAWKCLGFIMLHPPSSSPSRFPLRFRSLSLKDFAKQAVLDRYAQFFVLLSKLPFTDLDAALNRALECLAESFALVKHDIANGILSEIATMYEFIAEQILPVDVDQGEQIYKSAIDVLELINKSVFEIYRKLGRNRVKCAVSSRAPLTDSYATLLSSTNSDRSPVLVHRIFAVKHLQTAKLAMQQDLGDLVDVSLYKELGYAWLELGFSLRSEEFVYSGGVLPVKSPAEVDSDGFLADHAFRLAISNFVLTDELFVDLDIAYEHYAKYATYRFNSLVDSGFNVDSEGFVDYAVFALHMWDGCLKPVNAAGNSLIYLYRLVERTKLALKLHSSMTEPELHQPTLLDDSLTAILRVTEFDAAIISKSCVDEYLGVIRKLLLAFYRSKNQKSPLLKKLCDMCLRAIDLSVLESMRVVWDARNGINID